MYWLIIFIIISFFIGFLVGRLTKGHKVFDNNDSFMHVEPNVSTTKEDENMEFNLHNKIDTEIEKEQKRIANEIHDDTVQRMVALRFGFEQLLHYPIPEKATVEIKKLRIEIDGIISTLRYLIKGLVQPRFDSKPITFHIKELAAKLSAMHHQKVSFEVINPELEFKLTSQENQELYYLVHEAVHNYLKSSLGFVLKIRMLWGPRLEISITDNGQGVQRGRGYGIGMISMNERADRIGAELVFNSTFSGLNILIRMKNKSLQNTITK